MEKIHASDNVSEQEVRSELDRLLQSPHFLQSDRLGRFLRFAIDNALAGNTDLLKESVIGSEVYDRKPPYHPSNDSIVRTEARRLRAKLKDYYESGGREDAVFIHFRPGTYVPVFRRNETLLAPSNMSSFEGDLLTKGAGVGVAVLPFVDLSSRPLSALCARGITDELIHALTHADGVRVITRTSQSPLVDAPYDIPFLSQKLGITNFVEGTVREDYNRLRITAKVLGSDGFQMSSHRFETAANAESLAAVQEQIATAFVSRARPELSRIRRRKAAPGALTLAVYPLVLHAETLLDEGPATDVPAALLKFQEAREVAPFYARSYCGISHCQAELALRGVNSSSALISRAKDAALRAIELDPEGIESYSCLGSAQALEWDWENAEKSFHHGINLGTHVSASRRYALFLAALGRYDEATYHLENAQRIDPFSNRQKVSRAKLFHITRRYEEGLRQLSEPALYGPFPMEAKLLMALMAAHLGNHDQAKQLIESIRPAFGGQSPMIANIAEALALIGEIEQANQIVQDFKLLSPEAPISRFRQALLSLAFQDGERALSLLAQSVEHKEAELIWIGVEPRLDSLRGTAAFKDLADRVLPGSAD